MPLRRQLDSILGQRATKTVDARAGAIVVPLQRRDDPDLAVAEFDDMHGGTIGRGLIVRADAGVGAVRPIDPDIDKGNGVIGEQLPQAVVMAVAAQDQTIDAAADEVARLLQFDIEIVAAGGQQQHVADRRQIFLQRRDAARKHRVVDGRDDGSQRAGTPRRERACRSVRDVADRLHGFGDARAQFGAHGVRAVERARHRSRRDAGARRDRADALFRRPPGMRFHYVSPRLCNVT